MTRTCYCGSKSSKHLYSESISDIEDCPLGSNINVYMCSCGFIFSDNNRNQSDYDAHYTQNVAYMKGKISGEKRYYETVEVVKKYMTDTNQKIADIGCGPGTILNILKNEGYTNLVGVEPSKELLNIEGVRHVQSSIFDFEEHCDLVILSHILEHVYDIDRAMKCIHADKIYVEVPNAQKYSTRLPFQDFNIEHINHFTHKSLTDLFDRYGYSCIEFFEKMIEGWYPAICAVFEKRPTEWTYIQESQKRLDLMKQKVGDQKVNILGAGILGRRFINTFNVQRVFDDAPWLQGKKIGNFTIEPFDEHDETPLITSNFHIPPKGKNNINIW